ncbi:hypothetical protein V5N11_002349 [Cardamine amara subsp. amara]|uniref:Uncharacterized protein n=1 Tax=Cardamine amara subsp. amara TaxID=228776 RepID=A0ABD0ZA19_CARAN
MVELRSRTHLNSHMHYIRAIKDGSIKIVMNRVARGKAKLKFRQLGDVYNGENIEDDDVAIPIVVRDLEDVPDIGAEVGVKTDPGDFTMTLEKIRKQCKEKKRKLRNNRRDTETASIVEVKKECLTQDEGCDFEEPLSNWDTKFSKRRKKKQELPLFCDVKPEAWDDSYSVSEAMDFIPTDPLLDCNNESESHINIVSEEEEIMHDSSKDSRLALSCIEKPNSPGKVAVEEPIEPVEKALEDASEEHNAATKVECCLALENKEIILYDSVSTEEMELDVQQHSEPENIDSFNTTSSGVEEVKEDEESNDSKCNLDMTITGLEIVKVEEALEIPAVDYSSLSIMDFVLENTETVWETEDISKDVLRQATDIFQLTYCCNSLDNLQPVPDNSTISFQEDQLPERLQQPSSSKEEDEEAEYQKLSQLYWANPDEFRKAAETDSIQQQKLHHQPEKLLSGRKALSPTSQEKLRKAMEHPESSLEKRSKKSKGKLYFSSQNSHRFLKAQGLDNIDRVEISPSSKQVIQKANNSTRQTQNQRATRKFPRTRAAKTQPFSTGRTTMQECSQKAISFSQGQMLDFRHVAAKLTKELKTMRQLTKKCLLAESNTSDCNLDEVKTLIRNAEKTEESSKKWLSMIERNSNRFCKLMGMVKEDSPATENIVQKKKTIKFADDAGGDLCHVKVFEIDLESES